MSQPLTIHQLPPDVTRRIAAGEVIERPHGVVRELLDNSLDAGASRIEVSIEGGGIDRVRVHDDGIGMSPEDLRRCFLPHATSKIRSEEDLQTIRTLGFRGEALSSVAAVSRLTLQSATEGSIAHEIRLEAGIERGFAPVAGGRGTTVDVADIFFNVPARRSFLKNVSGESALCRSVFIDKALAFPHVAFRWSSNGELRHALEPSDQIGRIVAAYPERAEPSRMQRLAGSGDGFEFEVIAGEPSLHRKDRKHVQVFVNRRRITEYALTQAVEYSYRDYLHGGLYPVVYLFLSVDPSLVDFNVHPTKREVRFRNLPDIHRRVVEVLSSFLRAFDHRAAIQNHELPYRADPSGARYTAPVEARPVSAGEPRVTYDLTRVLSHHAGERPDAAPDDFVYIGQLFDLFLIVERGASLFLIDQHAAHERIIFDRLRGGGHGQELLFPVRLEVDERSAATLEAQTGFLERLGISVEQRDGGWELVSTPASVAIEAESLAALVMELLERPADFERELYASLSCRSAVMDGDRLPPQRALEIVRGVIGLENARCPHGRPIWVELTREKLAELVGRT